MADSVLDRATANLWIYSGCKVKKEVEDFLKYINQNSKGKIYNTSFKNMFDGINSKLHTIEKSNLKAERYKWLKMSQWK